MLKHFDGVQLGLTATPCVVRSEVLDSLPDEEDKAFVRDTLRFFEVDKPTYRYTLREAINAGYLVPYQIYQALDRQDRGRGRLRGQPRRARLVRYGRSDPSRARGAVSGPAQDHGRPERSGAAVHDPRAQPSDRARVPGSP